MQVEKKKFQLVSFTSVIKTILKIRRFIQVFEIKVLHISEFLNIS